MKKSMGKKPVVFNETNVICRVNIWQEAFTSFITNASGGLEVGLADPSLGGSGAVERQRIKINTPPQVMLVAQNQHWEIETENDVVYATVEAWVADGWMMLDKNVALRCRNRLKFNKATQHIIKQARLDAMLTIAQHKARCVSRRNSTQDATEDDVDDALAQRLHAMQLDKVSVQQLAVASKKAPPALPLKSNVTVRATTAAELAEAAADEEEPTLDDYTDKQLSTLLVVDLKGLCDRNGIQYVTRVKKSELVDALVHFRKTGSAPDTAIGSAASTPATTPTSTPKGSRVGKAAAKLDVDELVKNNTRAQLVDMCTAAKLSFGARDTKQMLAQALADAPAPKSTGSGTAKAAPKATSSPKAGAKLSLKTATESQLQATAGITASQAQGLIAYRDKTGIASWDDVKKATRSDVAVTKLQACAKLK